ncbi:MAG: murein biosynthesis integral membrane protein MurJ [Phycisphaerales bacterium]|nr:murein biosynthesis integral membrane protein MurJ [Phycisphaerales bacterium]
MDAADNQPESRPQPPAPAPPAATSADRVGGHALGSAVRVTSLVTVASRFGGLARDLLVGLMFKDTALGSAFSFAFAIPNLFRRLFGEGALSAAFVPEYTQTHKRDPANADRLASLTMVWLALVTTVLTVLGELALLIALLTLPPDEERFMAITLTMVMLPFMPFICMAAILSGMLQVHSKFGPAASGPLILNAFIIGVGLWYVLRGEAATLTAGVIIGIATTLSGLTQVLWFLWLLRRDVRWTRNTAGAREAGQTMLKRFVPVLIGAGTLQLNTFIDLLIASFPIWVGPTILGIAYPLDDASATILAMTSRIYQFPLGVFGIAVAAAVFPLLSRAADEPGEFASVLRRGARLSLFIAVPATIGLVLVRHDATAALVPTFSDIGKARCADVLLGFSLGVWAYSLTHVFTRAFYALGDTKTPMRIAIWMVAINVALNLTLIWPLREAGLAWSTSICAAAQVLILWRILSRRASIQLDNATLNAILKILLMSGLMAVAVLALTLIWPATPEDRWRIHALRLLASTALGAAAYIGAAKALNAPELGWLLSRGRRPNP